MPFPTDVEDLVVDANETLDNLNLSLDGFDVALAQEQATVAFIAPNSSMSKNDAPKDILVKLYTAGGQPLQSAVTVNVQDAGGSAQLGVHYNFSPASVVFPINSPHGDTETVTVTAIPSAITSDKTALLKLNPGKLGTIEQHELKITDVWYYEFDFTQSEGGWTPSYMGVVPQGAANYVSDTGWSYVDSQSGASPITYSRWCVIEKEFPATVITNVEVEIQRTPGSSVPPFTARIDSPLNTARFSTNNNWNGTQTWSWSGSLNAVQVVVAGRSMVASSLGALSGSVVIKRVTMRGVGQNPFGSSNC